MTLYLKGKDVDATNAYTSLKEKGFNLQKIIRDWLIVFNGEIGEYNNATKTVEELD